VQREPIGETRETRMESVRRELAGFEQLNTWYYADEPKTERPRLELARRTSTFEEAVGGLDETKRPARSAPVPIVRELLRVRQLLRYLPDNAVVKLGTCSRVTNRRGPTLLHQGSSR